MFKVFLSQKRVYLAFLSHVLLFILSINTIGLDTIPELTWRTYIFSMIKIIQI